MASQQRGTTITMDEAEVPGAPGNVRRHWLDNALTRSLMEGIIVVGVMAGLQPSGRVFSKETLMVGVLAGLGTFIVDNVAPRSSDSFRNAWNAMPLGGGVS